MSKEIGKYCVVCWSRYFGVSHNAMPLFRGNCCDKCERIVRRIRIERLGLTPVIADRAT